MSLSILGSSLSILLENKVEVEISQDFEEEKNENVKDLEEVDKILQLSFVDLNALCEYSNLPTHYNEAFSAAYIDDILIPPPDVE